MGKRQFFRLRNNPFRACTTEETFFSLPGWNGVNCFSREGLCSHTAHMNDDMFSSDLHFPDWRGKGDPYVCRDRRRFHLPRLHTLSMPSRTCLSLHRTQDRSSHPGVSRKACPVRSLHQGRPLPDHRYNRIPRISILSYWGTSLSSFGFLDLCLPFMRKLSSIWKRFNFIRMTGACQEKSQRDIILM